MTHPGVEPAPPRVTVVVPFQNSRKFVRSCVESLLAQDVPDGGFEILMVDNGSTDGSADIIREYARVRVISQPRPGPYAARNLGIAEARGEIIAFTDADCSPHRSWLRALCEALRAPETSIVQGPQVFAGRSPLLTLLATYESEKNAFIFEEGPAEVVYACANSLAIRRSLLEEMGRFDERVRGADVIFVQRALRSHSRDIVKYAPGARVVHLEINSTGKWLKKLFIYGRSYEAYRRIEPCRPLSSGERLMIARRLAKRRPAAIPALVLGPILVLGALSYEAGRWSGRHASASRSASRL